MLLSYLLPDSSEVIRYNLPNLPVCIKTIKTGPGPKAEPYYQKHWHEDSEFLCIRKGTLSLSVNETELILREGDCLVIKPRQMHRLIHSRSIGCIVWSVHVDLNLFMANRTFPAEMLRLVFYDMHLPYHLLASSHSRSEVLNGLFEKLFEMNESSPSFLLRTVSVLYEILAEFYDCFHNKALEKSSQSDTDVLNQMVSYIAQFYGEKLQLNDIARSGKVCRNRCCDIFKEYLGLTPIVFLNSYRLSMSKDMLLSSRQKISSISAACGFPHQSYYSRLFAAKYGCTPKEYRLQNNQ